ALAVVLALAGGTSATLVLLVRHEPESYRRACLPPGPVRAQRSREFADEFTQLISAIDPKSERDWDIRLTDEQINSYFAEDFKKSGVDKRLLPEKITEPRVLLEPGKVRLAFRYGSGLWSTIVSLDFGVWLTEEPNVVALELQRLHAASLPVGAPLVLDSLTKVVEENRSIQVNWYRYNGNSVALLRFQPDQRDTTVQLQTLQIDQGSIIIRGRPVEAGSARAASLPTQKPAGN